MKKFFILIALLLIGLLLSPVSATTWTSASGCWTATDGAYNLVMWNATGTSSWSVPSGVSAGGTTGGDSMFGGITSKGGGVPANYMELNSNRWCIREMRFNPNGIQFPCDYYVGYLNGNLPLRGAEI